MCSLLIADKGNPYMLPLCLEYAIQAQWPNLDGVIYSGCRKRGGKRRHYIWTGGKYLWIIIICLLILSHVSLAVCALCPITQHWLMSFQSRHKLLFWHYLTSPIEQRLLLFFWDMGNSTLPGIVTKLSTQYTPKTGFITQFLGSISHLHYVKLSIFGASRLLSYPSAKNK